MSRYEVSLDVKVAIEGLTQKHHFYEDLGHYYIDESKRWLSINYYDSVTDSYPTKTLDQICQDLYSTDFSAQSTIVAEKPVILRTQTYIGSHNIVLREFGYNFIATANTNTAGDMVLPVKYLRGAGFETEDHVFGDSITVQIVDKDNVLGYGAGLVVNTFGQTIQIPRTGFFTVLSEAISSAIPTGLYFRVIYHSVGTTSVKMRVNCRGYNDV